MLEFEAEKVLLLSDARRQVAHAPKNFKVHKVFQQSIFKSQVKEGGCQVCVCDQFMQSSLIG